MWYWRRLLRIPWTAGRSNQSILREISPGCSLEGLMLKVKLQYFGHLITKSWLIGKDPDAGKDWRPEEKGTTEDEMVGWHGFGWTLGVGDGQGGLGCCGSWGRKELDMAEWLNWTELLCHASSIQFSRSVVSDSLRPHESQHSRPSCPSPTPGVHANSCGSSRWCHPDISSSVFPYSSCPQSLSVLGSFPMSKIFKWGGQIIGVSASASPLPMNTQDSSPIGWTGWISLQSKGLSRVFSNATVQKHQFFGAQLSL